MTAPILLVDDDESYRNRLKRALSERDFSVVDAANVTAAMAIAREQKLGGVVTDLRMPGISGLEFVRDLTAIVPGLPIVVLTGFGSIASALEAVRLGALDYLTKPADPDQLIAVLRTGRPLEINPRVTSPEVPSLDRVEWEHIQRVLTECQDNISHAAKLLGLDRRTLQRKLAKYPPGR
jgi:two-component system response regulator RegA